MAGTYEKKHDYTKRIVKRLEIDRKISNSMHKLFACLHKYYCIKPRKLA